MSASRRVSVRRSFELDTFPYDGEKDRDRAANSAANRVRSLTVWLPPPEDITLGRAHHPQRSDHPASYDVQCYYAPGGESAAREYALRAFAILEYVRACEHAEYLADRVRALGLELPALKRAEEKSR
jgi:hypothetical protein